MQIAANQPQEDTHTAQNGISCCHHRCHSSFCKTRFDAPMPSGCGHSHDQRSTCVPTYIYLCMDWCCALALQSHLLATIDQVARFVWVSCLAHGYIASRLSSTDRSRVSTEFMAATTTPATTGRRCYAIKIWMMHRTKHSSELLSRIRDGRANAFGQTSCLSCALLNFA